MSIRRRRALFTALLILYTLFVFSNSLDMGPSSSSKSGAVLALVNGFFDSVGLPLHLSEHFVRKAAHFAEYFVLGALALVVYRDRFNLDARGRWRWPAFASTPPAGSPTWRSPSFTACSSPCVTRASSSWCPGAPGRSAMSGSTLRAPSPGWPQLPSSFGCGAATGQKAAKIDVISL